MFTLLKHPMHKAMHLCNTKRQREIFDIRNVTIIEHANSECVESNWLTRFLSNNKHDMLTEKDLSIAKEILKRKCLIGIIKDNDDDDNDINYTNESIHRFIQYFNLNHNNNNGQQVEQKQCYENFIHQTIKENNDNLNFENDSNDNEEIQGHRDSNIMLQEDSEEWKTLLQKNSFDMKVYEYALQLFEEQGVSIKKYVNNDNSVSNIL